MAKLTKKQIDDLRPQDRDQVLWDSEVKGLGLRCMKNTGHKSFIIQYRAEGRSRRLTLGAYGTLTLHQARQLARKKLAEVAGGADPAEDKKRGRQALTLRELGERYLREHARPKKKPASAFRDERLLDRFVLPELGSRKVKSITRADVAQLHHKIGRTTPIQANRTLAVLSKMLSLAIAWGLYPHGNPCKYIQRFQEKKRERFLSSEELSRLGKALSDAEKAGASPASVAVIRLLVLSGARLNEILSLEWSWIDFDQGVARLPFSKTGSKTLPLGAPALEVLRSIPRTASRFVFPGEKPGRHLTDINYWWRKVRDAAKLKNVRAHDLRHSFASQGASAGVSLVLLGGILGHQTPATTARYSHLSQSPVKQAADQISSLVAEALAREPEEKVVSLPYKDGGESG